MQQRAVGVERASWTTGPHFSEKAVKQYPDFQVLVHTSVRSAKIAIDRQPNIVSGKLDESRIRDAVDLQPMRVIDDHSCRDHGCDDCEAMDRTKSTKTAGAEI